MPYNCDVYADVDFGRGPVEVRCTHTGPHEVHTCFVVIGSITEAGAKELLQEKAANVFKNEDQLKEEIGISSVEKPPWGTSLHRRNRPNPL